MRKLIAVLIVFIIASALPVRAAEWPKAATEWTEKDVTEYVQMTMYTYLNDAKFTSAKDAMTRTSTHLAVAMQILRNEGIVYRFDIAAYTKDNDAAFVVVKIMKDVGNEPFGIAFGITKNDDPAEAPKVTQKRIRA